MKCQFKRSVSVICALLLIFSTLSLSACGHSVAPTVSTSNAGETSQPATTESKDTTPKFISGEWRTVAGDYYYSFIFHKDMTMESIIAYEDGTLVEHTGGDYSVNGSIIEMKYEFFGGPRSAYTTYNPDDHTLYSFVSDEGFLPIVTESVDGPFSIVGTWKPINNSDLFYFYTSVCPDANITFYNDGTFSIDNYVNNRMMTYGTYQMIHDGTAIHFDNIDGHNSVVMACTLLSENLLYIEARDGSSDYYVWTRID